MKTFSGYMLERELLDVEQSPLADSFAFVGWYIRAVNENAGVEELQNHPESKGAIQFIYDIAAKFKSAIGSVPALLKQLGNDPMSVFRNLKGKVRQIAQDFDKKLADVKAKAQAAGANVSESVLGTLGGIAMSGLKFLVQKILSPIVMWLLNGIKKTFVNVMMVPFEGFKESKFRGLVDGVCALLLTVLLWPYAVSIGGLAVAPVGGGIFMWTVMWWFLMWFKYNILAPALKYTDGNPGMAYA